MTGLQTPTLADLAQGPKSAAGHGQRGVHSQHEPEGLCRGRIQPGPARNAAALVAQSANSPRADTVLLSAKVRRSHIGSLGLGEVMQLRTFASIDLDFCHIGVIYCLDQVG